MKYAIEEISAIEQRGRLNGSCAGCGWTGALARISVPGDPGPNRQSFVYSHCPRCGTLSLVEPPADMSSYYPDDYYSFSVKKLHPLRRLARNVRNAMTLFDRSAVSGVSARLASNRSFLSLRPLFSGMLGRRFLRSDAILDVGCGDGQKLYDLRELGFSNLTGIDPYARAPVTSEGFSIRRATLDEIDGRFDVIVFNHSLEHLNDPEHALLTAATLLNAGGMLVIRIPLTGGWAWRTFGGEWAQLDAPRHIHLFSEQGFRSLAERAGWRVAHMLYDSGTLQFAGSHLRLAGVNYHKSPRELEARFSRAELRGFALHAERLNRDADGDMATFFLASATC